MVNTAMPAGHPAGVTPLRTSDVVAATTDSIATPVNNAEANTPTRPPTIDRPTPVAIIAHRTAIARPSSARSSSRCQIHGPGKLAAASTTQNAVTTAAEAPSATRSATTKVR